MVGSGFQPGGLADGDGVVASAGDRHGMELVSPWLRSAVVVGSLALAVLALAVLVMAVVAGSVGLEGIGESATPAGPSSSAEPGYPPPTIDARSLIHGHHPLLVPQLIGLPEDEARHWAEESGFETVARSDEALGADQLSVGERLIITIEIDGTVSDAVSR